MGSDGAAHAAAYVAGLLERIRVAHDAAAGRRRAAPDQRRAVGGPPSTATMSGRGGRRARRDLSRFARRRLRRIGCDGDVAFGAGRRIEARRNSDTIRGATGRRRLETMPGSNAAISGNCSQLSELCRLGMMQRRSDPPSHRTTVGGQEQGIPWEGRSLPASVRHAYVLVKGDAGFVTKPTCDRRKFDALPPQPVRRAPGGRSPTRRSTRRPRQRAGHTVCRTRAAPLPLSAE